MGLFGAIGNSVGNVLGFGSGQNDYYKPQNATYLDDYASEQGAKRGIQLDSRLNGSLNAYGRGEMGLNEYLSGLGALNPLQQETMAEKLATSPLTGSRYATDQVRSNPILGTLFGAGGSLERAGAEEADLSSRGYQLQPEDREAYGQASGDISRMFGEQENSLSNSLAMRGLSNSASLSGSQFSGLQGNKMEQLAKMQTNIADKRMNNNMNRLAQTRSYLSNMGSLGNTAIQNQFGRNVSGLEYSQNAQNQSLQNMMSIYGMKEGLAQKSFQSKQDNQQPTIWDAASKGLYSGVEAATGGAVAGGLSGFMPGGGGTSKTAGGSASLSNSGSLPTSSSGYFNQSNPYSG